MRIYALLFGLAHLATAGPPSRTICNETPCGELKAKPCLALYRSFTDGQENHLRIFDEEQLQEVEGRAWSGIVNPFKTRVQQVPRF